MSNKPRSSAIEKAIRDKAENRRIWNEYLDANPSHRSEWDALDTLAKINDTTPIQKVA